MSTIRHFLFAWMILLMTVVAADAATLLRQNFETSNPWTAMAGYSTSAGGSVSATPTWTAAGTIVTYGSSTPSSGIQLAVNSSGATGNWTAGVNSGVLSLLSSNTRGLPFLTLSFSLSASSSFPIRVRVESYNSANARTGGLSTLIYPAAADFYQRYAIDLDKMIPDGVGTFVPTDPKLQISFELDSTVNGTGWQASATHIVKIDNVNYATPKYYVKPASLGGSDGKTGLDEANALATVQAAANKNLTGDNIIAIMDDGVAGGIDYVSSNINGDMVNISKPGAPDAWIVFKNYPGQTPVLQTSGWDLFRICNNSSGGAAAYVEVRGLNLRGQSSVDVNGDRQINPAYQSYVGLVDSRSNGNGIGVDGGFNTTNRPHDIRVADNTIEYFAGGNGAGSGDRFTFENNVIRYNCWWMIYAGSGISFGFVVDTESGANYRMLIQNNVVYGNECMIPWKISSNPYSDGNGIIIDSYTAGYTGKTLIQNNLVFNNGGSGIHVLKASNVDIVHNTAYYNSASTSEAYGQIFTQSFGSSAGIWVKNVRVTNNIMVAPRNPTGVSSYLFDESATSVASSDPTTITHQRNVYIGGDVTPPLSGANFSDNTDRGRSYDPANTFISPSNDPAVADFRLRAAVATKYGAAVGYRSTRDLNQTPRSLTGSSDTGAYQSVTSVTYPPMFSPKPDNYSSSQSVTLSSDTVGATIVYTTNGTTPTVDGSGNPVNGTRYTAPFPISTATTVKAVAWKSGLTSSPVETAIYTFQNLTNVPVTLSAESPTGIYNGTRISQPLTKTPGAEIRYTTDGSNPTATTGTPQDYRGYTVIDYASLRYQAYKAGRANSAVVTTNITVRAAMGSTADGTSLSSVGANTIRYIRFHPAATFSAAYVFARVAGITGNYRAAVYAESGSAPSARLAVSSPVTNPTTGWVAFPLTGRTTLTNKDSSSNDAYYWLAIWSDSAAAGIYSTATGGTVREQAVTYSSNWPNPAGGSTAVSGTANYAIYATNAPPNLAPVVNAGADQNIGSGVTANLSGTASDDGVPAAPGTVSTIWSKVSGPGNVSFGNPASASTTATFSANGTYLLRLTAQDTLLSAYSEMTVNVGASGSLDPTPPAGVVHAGFSDGFGSTWPQQYPGISGDGWAAPWAASTNVSTTVANTSPLCSGSGNYLNVATVARTDGSTGLLQEGVWRQWSATTRPVNQMTRVTFDFRIDSDSTFSASGDTYNISINSTAGASPGGNSSAYLRCFGASPGASFDGSIIQAREFCVFNGTPGTADTYNINRLRRTGLIAVPGVTYTITLDIYGSDVAGTTGGKTNGTYDVTITDQTTTKKVLGSGFRTAAYTSGPYVAFSAQQNTTYNPLGFSVDNLEISTIAPTNTTLTTSNAAADFGELVILTASVTSAPATPGGFVTFLDGNISLGTASLNGSGIATLGTSSLSPGTHSITATYADAPYYLSSVSAPLSQSIRTSTFTSLYSDPNPSNLGSQVTFYASVVSDTGTPTGTVTFWDGGTSLGTVALDASGFASVSTSALSIGYHSVIAYYNGDAANSATPSSVSMQTVQRTDGTTRLVAINTGGPSIAGANFSEDQGFDSGTATTYPGTINLSAAAYPGPAVIYQTERYGSSMTYSIAGLTPSAGYLVRLHFCENWWGISGRGGTANTVGKRLINVNINGTRRLSNFDIWATAGASSKVVIREFAAAANSSGKITINLASAPGSQDANAEINALEINTLTPTDAWRAQNFSPAQLDDPAISGLLADPDGDGIPNLLERALGTDPLGSSTGGLPIAGIDPATGALTLTFYRASDDLTYSVEGSSSLTNLNSWSPIPFLPGPVGAWETVIDTVNVPPRFLRLRVSQ